MHVDHPEKHKLTIASFFSGYEGLGIGVKQALGGNARVIVACEIESYAVANLIAKMEDGQLDACPVFTDMRTFPYRRFRGLVDIACGGVPCQPHSVAGKRKGGNDERFLFDAFFDGLAEMQPGQIFIENVEGLLTSKMPDGSLCFRHIIERLEKMDYRVEAGLFTAAEVGAPHRRKRVFILAHANGINRRTQAEEWLDKGQTGSAGEAMANACEFGRGVRNQGGREVRERGLPEDKIEGPGASPEDDGHAEHDGRAGLQEPEGIGTRDDASNGTGEPEQSAGYGGCAVRTANVADTDQPGSQGWASGELPERAVKWPARPGSPQYDWEEPRVTQQSMGQSVDGTSRRLGRTSTRVDELRLLGNGVVPQQAARAYMVLIERMKK